VASTIPNSGIKKIVKNSFTTANFHLSILDAASGTDNIKLSPKYFMEKAGFHKQFKKSFKNGFSITINFHR
jgi:hypothetical protein